MVLLVAALYRLGVAGMRTRRQRAARAPSSRGASRTRSCRSRSRTSLAHYFSLLVFQGQALVYLVSDPLGNGSNLFGTAGHDRLQRRSRRPRSGTSRWPRSWSGHVAGLVLAHDRALTLYKDARDATRSQYWMLAVMVAFTSLGLWLLSTIKV